MGSREGKGVAREKRGSGVGRREESIKKWKGKQKGGERKADGERGKEMGRNGEAE